MKEKIPFDLVSDSGEKFCASCIAEASIYAIAEERAFKDMTISQVEIRHEESESTSEPIKCLTIYDLPDNFSKTCPDDLSEFICGQLVEKVLEAHPNLKDELYAEYKQRYLDNLYSFHKEAR